MNLNDAQKVLNYKSPIDVRITRFLFRMVCLHRYMDHVSTSKTLLGPIIVSECKNCGKRKYKSMDGA